MTLPEQYKSNGCNSGCRAHVPREELQGCQQLELGSNCNSNQKRHADRGAQSPLARAHNQSFSIVGQKHAQVMTCRDLPHSHQQPSAQEQSRCLMESEPLDGGGEQAASSIQPSLYFQRPMVEAGSCAACVIGQSAALYLYLSSQVTISHTSVLGVP